MLIAHDREVWTGCGVRLERAVASAQSLYGREPSPDAFLRKTQLTQLSVPELRTTIESLQSLLAGLDVLCVWTPPEARRWFKHKSLHC